MEIISGDINQVFTLATDLVLREKKVYNLIVSFESGGADKSIGAALDKAFNYKKRGKAYKDILWSEWLINGVFPKMLYEQCNEDLHDLINSDYFTAEPSLSYKKKDTYHSQFGRMARPHGIFEDTEWVGFLDWMISRWSDSTQSYSKRSMPHFYFDVENPTWIFEPLVKKPNLPRHSRTAFSCICNFSFRWNVEKSRIQLTLLLKHNQWSHLYGDIYGASLIVRALNKHMGYENEGEIVVHAMASSMDDAKTARKYLREVGYYD